MLCTIDSLGNLLLGSFNLALSSCSWSAPPPSATNLITMDSVLPYYYRRRGQENKVSGTEESKTGKMGCNNSKP